MKAINFSPLHTVWGAHWPQEGVHRKFHLPPAQRSVTCPHKKGVWVHFKGWFLFDTSALYRMLLQTAVQVTAVYTYTGVTFVNSLAESLVKLLPWVVKDVTDFELSRSIWEAFPLHTSHEESLCCRYDHVRCLSLLNGVLCLLPLEKLKGTSEGQQHDCASHCVRFFWHAKNFGSGCTSLFEVLYGYVGLSLFMCNISAVLVSKCCE
jgi:hypothetical protein